MQKRCCPQCFGDRGLRNDIIPALDPGRGTCDFCGSKDVHLIEPRQIADVFETLVGAYEESTDGKQLVQWMKEDWQLFSHPTMDVAHAKELLSEILDDGDITRRYFRPSEFLSGALAQWEKLRDELMYVNRYFLDNALDEDREEHLGQLLGHLPADDLPETWYRARMKIGEGVFPIEEMGAPPRRLAAHGRANPSGIPYLYLGSQPVTAAAEIRPHTGEVACVAEFKLSGPVKAVDLRNPRGLVSPFVLGSASAIAQLRADLPFLERLGDELTRPVQPQSAAIDYLPSQYFCEFIKKRGYDGVVYRSSVSDGINLALFDPSKARGIRVAEYTISKVSVDVAQI
jgi:hypothetical protein